MGGTDETTRTTTAAFCRALPALALLALAVAVGTPAHAQLPLPGSTSGRELVAEVIVVGNRSITTDRIMREIHTRPNLNFSSEAVQEDINRLAATHLFKHLAVRTQNTSDGRINVIYEVQEHPNIVREVIFKHAKHLTDEELMAMTRIRKGMPLDKTLNQLAVFEIQDALKKKGRYWANVTLEEGFDESHSRVVFNITEGPKVRVRNTWFTGNDFISSARLRTQIETSRAIFKTIGGEYQPLLLQEDIHKLEEYYRKNGFLNVRVTYDIDFSDDLQFVDITYHIQEGLRFIVKMHTVEGGKSLPPEQLRTIIQIKDGEPFNESLVEKDKDSLAKYWGWRGYPVNVQPHVTLVPDEPGVVRVQYQIEERPPVTVGRVIIVGNTVTRDDVIRRVIGLYPGQVLRFPELRLAEQALQRLNIFEADPEKGMRPSVAALPTDDPNVMDILVTVKETHTGTFQIGAGFNTNNGLVGSIVLNERNFDITKLPTSWEDWVEGRAFRGGDQELRIEAMPGLIMQRYAITWRDPMIFDLPYSLTVSGYYRQYEYNEYLEERVGARFTVSKMLLPGLSINVGGRVETIGVDDVPAGAPVDYTSVQGQNFLVAPRVGVTYDKRDSFLFPTQGFIGDVSFEEAFGSYTFPIFNASFSQYFTVTQRKDGSGRSVLALRSQLGIEGDNAPVYERFFAGGMQSIRGFQFRGVGPNVDGFMTGGSFMWLNSVEYLFPLLANDALHFVTFLDSGTVEKNVGIMDYRVTAGFGFRISIPALGPVPIALDFGFPINRVASDQTQVFSIWFGMTR